MDALFSRNEYFAVRSADLDCWYFHGSPHGGTVLSSTRRASRSSLRAPVPQVIWSYQPDPISTIAFFCMAAVAAVSLLVTWFLGLAALGVTGVYAVAKATEMAQVSEGPVI